MINPKICTVITTKDEKDIAAATPLTDFFEVRIDLIGRGWQKLAKSLTKPWIATNRPQQEGGHWKGDEESRIKELYKAGKIGASIIDIELRTKGLAEIVKLIKRHSRCMISIHDFSKTPTLPQLVKTVEKQLQSSADICKVVTTAVKMDDNMTVLSLIRHFSANEMVSFAMGKEGRLSRILCPMVGGAFSYASLKAGSESATGQLSVGELSKIYGVVKID